MRRSVWVVFLTLCWTSVARNLFSQKHTLLLFFVFFIELTPDSLIQTCGTGTLYVTLYGIQTTPACYKQGLRVLKTVKLVWYNLHFLVRAAGYPHCAHIFFWMWYAFRPQRIHRVWVLLWRLPKLDVPLVYNESQNIKRLKSHAN